MACPWPRATDDSAMTPQSRSMAANVHPSKKTGYRPDIDGLRAVAVIAVIINHLDKTFLPSGHLGVDIFFVISGFVITSSLINHQSKDFQSFLLGFYERRFKRLLPALIVYTIIASLLICLVNPNPGLSLRTGMAALFGFSNVYLLSQESNYFSTDSDMNIFTHTWSLGVEEQFYLLFPLLVWFTGLKQDATRKQAFRFASILGTLMFVSWLVYKSLSASNPSAAFFLMPARFWELGSGSLCFLLSYYGPKNLLKRFHYPLPFLGMILICLSVQAQPWFSAYRLTTLLVLLTTLLLLSLQPGTFCRNLLSLKPLVTVGLMSYSLYLWHWGFTCLARWSIGINQFSIPLILGLTIASSVASYVAIENRFRYRIPKLKASNVLAIGLASSSVAAGFVFLLSNWLHPKFFMSVNNPLDRFDEINSFSIYDNCNYYYGMRKFNAADDFARCTFEPLSAQPVERSKKAPHIYYLGSSHASQLTGLMEHLQAITNHRQTMLVIHAIMNPPLPKALVGPPHNKEAWTDDAILIQNKIATHIFRTAQPGDVIVLGNQLVALATSAGDSQETANNKTVAMKAWLQKLAGFLEEAQQRNLNVVVLMPIPHFNPVQGLTRELCTPAWFRPSIPKNCFVSRDRKDIQTSLASINQDLKAMRLNHKNLYLFDPFTTICPGRTCQNFNKDGRLYSDHWHLNNRGSRLLSEPFLAFLDAHHLR